MTHKIPVVYVSKRQTLTFGLVIVAALVAILIWHQYSRSKLAGWPGARVALFKFRITPVQVLEGEQGSHVVYQAEAHVGYTVETKQYDKWLPVLTRSDSRQLLEFESNRLRGSPCYVHWNPAKPDQAYLSCERGS